MKKYLFSLLLIAVVFLVPAQEQQIFHITNVDSVSTIELNSGWKFHNGDDSTWAKVEFDDSQWDTVNTTLKFSTLDSSIFQGIGWFRLHLYIDSSTSNVPHYIFIAQQGASEIFIDGVRYYSIGKVSANADSQQTRNPPDIPFAFPNFTKGEHVLALRYSNINFRQNYKDYGTAPGFTMKLKKQKGVEHTLSQRSDNSVVTLAFAVFFFTLSFIHILFFFFYRKEKSNLYYSIYVGLLGALFLLPFIITNSSDPQFTERFDNLYTYLFPLFFYFMLLMEYSIFKRPYGKFFWFITFALIVFLLGAYFFSDSISETIWIYYLLSFSIGTVTASFFIVIKSIIKKAEGAWIVGTGSIFFLLLLAIILIKITVFGGGNFTTDSMFLAILIFLSIVSIPISMSIYLARNFAKTSKKLEKKLIEVEQLSVKTLEQEKEKQKILESQKETLEIQVTERTAEIVEQKAIIEAKNKDITDSINYARTIQKAILPTNEYVKQLFPNSFILFKPKDIVSGDFYWFTEKNGKRIVAACDCTGHGVPGGFMSMIGNNLLNHIVNENGCTSADEILNQLNKEMRKTLKQELQDETRDGMDSAVIVFHSNTEIEFSGAQRPLWVVEKTEAGYTLNETKGDKFAIGGFQLEKSRTFSKKQLHLSKGTSIYIFSDGFADQFSADDKKLMTSRFKELILKIQDLSMDDQERHLGNFIDNWRGKREQIDDILVIGLKVS